MLRDVLMFEVDGINIITELEFSGCRYGRGKESTFTFSIPVDLKGKL